MHYVVVDAALFGSGSLHTKILYLIQTNKNMFDYLELNESANEKAHAIYNRIYNRQFRAESQRDGSVFNEVDDNLSVHSVVDDDSASSKSSIPLGQPDEEESDSDSSNLSDDQPSKSDKSSSDLSPTDSSFTSDESKRARKSDG